MTYALAWWERHVMERGETLNLFIAQLTDLVRRKQINDENRNELIEHLARKLQLTYDDFNVLDEKPGHFGYTQGPDRIEGWHMWLRRVRNDRATKLFEVLAENEVES